ncbi:MAG: hypothetical protein WDZ63_00230 [Burkholderiales bacterium]
MNFLRDHKGEIIAAVVGALVAGLLSLATGLYSLNKAFQITQTKEIVTGLRTDIALLKNVERELDQNLNILLKGNSLITLQVEPKVLDSSSFGNAQSDKEFQKWYSEFLEWMPGRLYVVTSIEKPQDRFLFGAWPQAIVSSTDIDFELSQEISALNRKLQRINKFLERIDRLAVGVVLDEGSKNALLENIPQFNAAVSDLSQQGVLDLKNKVIAEIARLQKMREKIEF